MNDSFNNIIEDINNCSNYSGSDIGAIDQYFLPLELYSKISHKKGGSGIIFHNSLELSVILQPLNYDVIKYDFMKSYFDIKSVKFVVVSYNGKQYMMYKNHNDMKLSVYLKSMKFRNCKRFLGSFLHELRKNFAFAYIMGYKTISEDNIYVKYYTKDYKSSDGLDLIYPVSIIDSSPTSEEFPILQNNIITEEFEAIIDKWYNVDLNSDKYDIGHIRIGDYINKNPKELFIIYCDYLIKELQYNLKNGTYNSEENENNELKFLESKFGINDSHFKKCEMIV